MNGGDNYILPLTSFVAHGVGQVIGNLLVILIGLLLGRVGYAFANWIGVPFKSGFATLAAVAFMTSLQVLTPWAAMVIAAVFLAEAYYLVNHQAKPGPEKDT